MEAYTGIDVLEIMDGAKNYNAFLTDLIGVEAAIAGLIVFAPKA